MGVRPQRKSRLVFWLFMIAIAAAIAATALLANDKKNLRELIQRYKITWIVLPGPAEAPKPLTVARRGNRLIPTAATMPSRMPAHAFEDFGAPGTAFVRRWQVSGTELCADFGKAGLDVEAWHQGDLYSSTYECSSQLSGSDTSSPDNASFFLLVRGTPSGDISSVRIKVILPDTKDGRLMEQKFQTAVEILFHDSKWGELVDALDSINSLQNVSLSTFGARLTFAHEFTDRRRFNLILDLYPETPDQKLTAAYFDRSKRLPAQPAQEN